LIGMGLLSVLVAYKVGRRRGRREVESNAEIVDGRNEECLNYSSFCLHFGGCNGMACEFPDPKGIEQS